MPSMVQENPVHPMETSPTPSPPLSIDDCINLFGMYLWESLDLVNRISIPHPEFTVYEDYASTSYQLLHIDLVNQMLVARHNWIVANYSKDEVQYFIFGLLDKLLRYMLSCKDSIRKGLCDYNIEYSIYTDSNRSQFDDILRITPAIVHQGLVLFYEDAITKIKNYKASQQEGGDALDFRIFETGQDLAIFYCTIMRTTVVAASFVRVCRFALARFISGDVRGCQLLLGRFLNDADILGLERLKNLESESTSDDE
ncbi:hypothetical protein H4219_004862 [Mycoemilia scoparia]|uniref:Uncharacterized protein n=1 Tax=Mycoemilia scoparia TaxID=417184 RepID=A0A9W8DM59_9FUNG|nr:hypothetical protein H4219_004862 [Mycoemilia scoparia]